MAKKDYEAAKEAYSALVKSIHQNPQYLPKQSLEWTSYIDIIVRYAYVVRLAGDVEASRRLLADLLKKSPPVEFLRRFTALRHVFYVNSMPPMRLIASIENSLSSSLYLHGKDPIAHFLLL